MKFTKLAVLSAAVIGVLALTACDPEPTPPKPPPKPKVLVLGDSITQEVRGAPYHGLLTVAAEWTPDWGVQYGGAPCGGLMYAKSIDYRPDVVLFNYSGNSSNWGPFGDCMAGVGAPDDTKSVRTDKLILRYTEDLQKTIDHFRNGHTKFVVVGAPHRPDIDSRRLLTALKQVATANGVPYRAVTHDFTVNGEQVRSVPCASFDGTQCGNNGAGPGRVHIRSSDMIHLCAKPSNALAGHCGIYNGGAMRLAQHFNFAVKAAKVPTKTK